MIWPCRRTQQGRSSCCAPCSSYVLEYLSRYFRITVLYYNPNISPREEFERRAAEQRRLLAEMPRATPLYLWQGDITTLRCDAIVNAANSGMTGCYVPNHRCIDNCIHTFAGVELRNACDRLMRRQGRPEPTGTAKITPAFKLPGRYVLHTGGHLSRGRVGLEARARRSTGPTGAATSLSTAIRTPRGQYITNY